MTWPFAGTYIKPSLYFIHVDIISIIMVLRLLTETQDIHTLYLTPG